ncbi:MAG: sigma-70 family RNA polymerase sigma factor [Gemmiger sp.]|nr:sigma-70 family RNA polymerase sigma factor [Gemmiger sp.]
MVELLGLLGSFIQAAAGQILYLALHLESGSFPRPLSLKAEQAAFAALQKGDPDARDRLIRHNLRLVAHVAKKYYAAPAGQDDLISIGTIGLIKAVNTYNPARAVRFASYASQCIENELRMHLRRTRREGVPASLQEPLEGGGGSDSGMLTLADVLPDDADMAQDFERSEAAAQLHHLLRTLDLGDARAGEILALRYGLNGSQPQTQQQVAARLGISRSYVSRLEKKALEKLRAALEKGNKQNGR